MPEPARAVGQPLRVDQALARHPQRRERRDEVVVGDRFAHERRRREGGRPAVATDAHEADAALLHDLVGTLRDTVAFEPRVAASERRMAGERQLASRG